MNESVLEVCTIHRVVDDSQPAMVERADDLSEHADQGVHCVRELLLSRCRIGMVERALGKRRRRGHMRVVDRVNTVGVVAPDDSGALQLHFEVSHARTLAGVAA